jgi:hypothetical protein
VRLETRGLNSQHSERSSSVVVSLSELVHEGRAPNARVATPSRPELDLAEVSEAASGSAQVPDYQQGNIPFCG